MLVSVVIFLYRKDKFLLVLIVCIDVHLLSRLIQYCRDFSPFSIFVTKTISIISDPFPNHFHKLYRLVTVAVAMRHSKFINNILLAEWMNTYSHIWVGG